MPVDAETKTPCFTITTAGLEALERRARDARAARAWLRFSAGAAGGRSRLAAELLHALDTANPNTSMAALEWLASVALGESAVRRLWARILLDELAELTRSAEPRT